MWLYRRSHIVMSKTVANKGIFETPHTGFMFQAEQKKGFKPTLAANGN